MGEPSFDVVALLIGVNVSPTPSGVNCAGHERHRAMILRYAHRGQ